MFGYTTDPQIRHYIEKAHADRSSHVWAFLAQIGRLINKTVKPRTKNGPDPVTRPAFG